MKTEKKLEDYSWEELLEATSGKEGLKEAGRDSGQYTLDNKIGIHIDDEELKTQWASMGGNASIEKLLQWQIANNFRVCDLERTDEWCNNISIALTGRKLPALVINKIKKTLTETMGAMTPEERREKYSSYSFLGKLHKDESKEKMREKANERVAELGENYISKERKEKMREENGQRVAVYHYNPNNTGGKGNLYKLFISCKQAKHFFKSGSISHVLKKRAKRFGADKNKDGFQGYFAEYISKEEYTNLLK